MKSWTWDLPTLRWRTGNGKNHLCLARRDENGIIILFSARPVKRMCPKSLEIFPATGFQKGSNMIWGIMEKQAFTDNTVHLSRSGSRALLRSPWQSARRHVRREKEHPLSDRHESAVRRNEKDHRNIGENIRQVRSSGVARICLEYERRGLRASRERRRFFPYLAPGTAPSRGTADFLKGARHVPRAFAQFSEQGPVVHEIDSKPFGVADLV